MPTDRPLWHKLYFQPLYTELAKLVGYSGFHFSQLAERMRPLFHQVSAPELRLVLDEMLTLKDNWVLLTDKARHLCWQLLGPPPEQWDTFYRHPDGTPMKRPKDRITPPAPPKIEDDPVVTFVQSLGNQQLLEKLEIARDNKPAKRDNTETANQTRHAIACLESMLVYRGMDIPPHETRKTAKKPARKRTRKQPSKKS